MAEGQVMLILGYFMSNSVVETYTIHAKDTGNNRCSGSLSSLALDRRIRGVPPVAYNMPHITNIEVVECPKELFFFFFSM